MFNAIDPHQSVLPMGSLNAVVLDMETTGLDTTSDHIVQIGAVRLVSGRIDRNDVFNELVKPGAPIPEDVTAIHGIDDKDVAGAADFAAIMPDFADWVGGRVVLGYSIGFDLAMLKTEHERAGLMWKRPRGLDIAHLVQLLSPALPSTALDTVAAWLGIEIRDRHQALGDALLAAEIYLALLPKLRGKGIFTLAEAERACLALTAKVDDEARAGWHEPVASKKADTPERRISRAQVDSFPYKYRLHEIMRSPPVILAGDASVRDVLRHMMKERVSSVFLQPSQDDEGFGILTERDVLRAIDGQGADALDQPASRFASRPLATLDRHEFAYRAISRMTGEGFRHLGIRDEAGTVVGAVSARDLLNQRSEDIITLGDHINHAQSSAELGRIWSGLASVAATLTEEDVNVFDIATIISNELQALTRRACEIAEHEFLESGKGAPPVPYAMLVLGSGGRGESLLSMDQDNAIVYERGEPGGATDRWFEALGKCVATILDETGVSYCQGEVMASNAAWRMDVTRWRERVAAWMADSRPENILNADIFFDGRPVHGQRELGEALMQDAFQTARQSRAFLSTLSARAAEFETPIGWFGRFKLEDGRVDLKKGGLMALFSTARVLALRHGITQHSTRERFLAARDHLDHGKEAIADLIEAHRIILDTILHQQLRDLDEGIPLSTRIKPSSLSNLQRQNLRWALDRVPLTLNLLGVGLYA
jgi:DNA polymerase-3 subunit epsilon/CBS domain-containing protein